METNDKLVGDLHKHVVPVLFTVQKEQDIQRFHITTFVMSISGQWFLITAGHCIQKVQEYLDSGYKIISSRLIDSLGTGAKCPNPIPFVYKESYPECLSEKYELDYGYMVLSLYYKRLLLANNVHALDEEVWKKQPAQVDCYKLLGIPSELVLVTSSNISITPSLLTVEVLKEKPDGFTEVNAPLFYGHINLGDGLESIKGMSGGPIFAFYKNKKGELRYWLTAIQSRWLPESSNIVACPAKRFGNILEEALFQLGLKLT